MAISVLKPHVFPKQIPLLHLQWPRTVSNGGLPCRRFLRLPLLLLLPRRLHLLPNSLSFLNRTHLSASPFPPLLRRRLQSLFAPMSSVTSGDAKTTCLCLFKHYILSNFVDKVRVVIKGRVQGVFYRNWTVDNAKDLGLKGWVRNRRDGSVEALFSGSPEKVLEMEQRCRRGPPDAMVTGLQVFPCTDDDLGNTFERKPTI